MIEAGMAIWGTHTGKTGDADALSRQGFVAIDWPEMGDLAALAATRDDSLDPRYKGLIPLKRVYVPEPLDNTQP